MNVESSLAFSDHVSRAAIIRMNTLKIPVTPQNFVVWYEYCAQTRPELNAHLDQLIKEETPFTDPINEEINQRFFGKSHQQSLETVRDAIGTIISNVTEKLSEFGPEINNYESTLALCEQKLSQKPDIQTLQQLVNQLLMDTRKTSAATHSVNESAAFLSQQVKELRAEVAHLSEDVLIDPLTSLYNRRAFEESYHKLLNEAKQRGYGLCVLMLDIDHFKRFNDKHGHIIGDLVLRFVASLLKRTIKGQDFAARYGGEEFVILLPETDYQGGVKLAELIRKAICKKELKTEQKKEPIGRVAVSVGVASYHPDDDCDSLLKRADKYLYEAKERGRNQVVCERGLPGAAYNKEEA